MFVNQGGISGSYNATSGLLTLVGTASVSTYQAALRSIRYANSAPFPNTATRSITYSVTDATQSSFDVTRPIDFRLPTVSFVTASSSITEGNPPFSIIVTLEVPSPSVVTVPISLSGSAQGSGVDFQANGIPVSIPIGQTSAAINVYVIDDAIAELDELIALTMLTPTNAIRATPFLHNVTLHDNEGAAPINLSLSTTSLSETGVAARVLATIPSPQSFRAYPNTEPTDR